MTKYKEYYQKMLQENEIVFKKFRRIHDEYALNMDTNQNEFNLLGKEVLTIIRVWEDKLCRQSEKGGFGVFSGKLADKFWNEVRHDFPEIDNVGLKVNTSGISDKFSIKKIKL
jgi:hypothetical protein